jgi:hypothetical protein
MNTEVVQENSRSRTVVHCQIKCTDWVESRSKSRNRCQFGSGLLDSPEILNTQDVVIDNLLISMFDNAISRPSGFSVFLIVVEFFNVHRRVTPTLIDFLSDAPHNRIHIVHPNLSRVHLLR